MTADRYTHGHHDSVLRSHSWRTLENSASHLDPHLRPGLEILDIGCGPGNLTAEMADRVAPGRVLGIDVSVDIVDTAQRTHTRPNLRFAVGDAYALELPDAGVDVVHAHQVLQHVSDPVAVLREAARVCRPGGIIAVRDADYAGMSWYPELPGLDDWRRVYRAVCHRNDAEPDAARHLLRWAGDAGLVDVSPSATVWCFATPADRAWWGGLWAERVVSSSLASQAVEYGLAAVADLEGIADAWREWADHPHAWFLVPNGELVARVEGPPQR